MKTFVYVDGFNLYYGVLKGTSYRWLDLGAFCSKLLPPNKIARIKYFTARIRARPGDPDAPSRQNVYLRALRTNPDLEIIFGHFMANKVRLPRADGSGFAYVIRTEEKGSDVNIAAHLIADAFRRRFEVAVLVTNDSDLAEPVRIVSQDLGLRIGILSPIKKPFRKASRELTRYSTFVKQIRQGVLRDSQFPEQMTDGQGTFSRPKSW